MTTKISVNAEGEKKHNLKIAVLEKLYLALRWSANFAGALQVTLNSEGIKEYFPESVTSRILKDLNSGGTMSNAFHSLNLFNEYELYVLAGYGASNGYSTSLEPIVFKELATHIAGYKLSVTVTS